MSQFQKLSLKGYGKKEDLKNSQKWDKLRTTEAYYPGPTKTRYKN